MKNFCEDLFFFFWRALALVSLVLRLGLDHSCPWPRECLSSERLSLVLASDFFVSLALASRVSVLGKAVLGLGLVFFCVLGLGLEPCVLDSTSAGYAPGYQCKLVCTGTMNNWWKILMIKTLTEVNRI